MNTEVYEKEYFNDDYSAQFSEMRDRFRARTQSAVSGRAVEEKPMPNATTVVMMQDTPDGGVTITTGDFVRYFNERYGINRLNAMKTSVQEAQRRSELKSPREKMAAMRKRNGKKTSEERRKLERRSFSPRFPLVRAVFGMMLVFSIGMLFATSALLDNVKGQVMELESEVAVMEATTENTKNATTNDAAQAPLSGEDSVEVFAPEEEESAVSVLLNALASLGKKS